MALEAGVKIHYGVKVDPTQCDIIAAGPKESSAVAFGEISGNQSSKSCDFPTK